MDTVKVEYIGPGKESDPRVLEVSEQEAKELVDGGLYRKKRAAQKSSSENKESD